MPIKPSDKMAWRKKNENKVKEVVKKPFRIFKCTSCSYSSYRSSNLQRHQQTMHNELVKKIECCGIQFATKCEKRKHSKTAHENGYPCEFDNCNKTFNRKILLDRHYYGHIDIKNFKCGDCNYASGHKSNVMRHCRVFGHVSSQVVECKQVTRKRKNSTATSIETNLSELSLEDSHSRTDALKSESTFSIKHFSKKGSKSFSCEKCNYCTERKSNLYRHELTMHKELEIKRQCCGVVFSTKSEKQNHQDIEHKNGYKCELTQCFMVFKTKTLVERHYKCHSNNKKFKCSECPYASHYKSNLERHESSKHDCPQLAEMNQIRRKRKSLHAPSTVTPTSTLPSTPAETPPESPTPKREHKEATWSFQKQKINDKNTRNNSESDFTDDSNIEEPETNVDLVPTDTENPSDSFEALEQLIACPICYVLVGKSYIETHVNHCLDFG